MSRVICFLDASNLFWHFLKLFGNGKFNQDALCMELAGSRDLVEWRYYTAPLHEGESDKQKMNYEAQQRFFTVLRQNPRALLCFGRLKHEGMGKFREKGVDVRLAIDLVRLAAEDRYDTAIVLSADEDLVPAVETVQEVYHKQVELALPDGAAAFHLNQAADTSQTITKELFERVVLKNG